MGDVRLAYSLAHGRNKDGMLTVASLSDSTEVKAQSRTRSLLKRLKIMPITDDDCLSKARDTHFSCSALRLDFPRNQFGCILAFLSSLAAPSHTRYLQFKAVQMHSKLNLARKYRSRASMTDLPGKV